MSVVGFSLRLAGDVSLFTSSVLDQMKSAIAVRAGVGPSAVELTVRAGSVIVGVSILTPMATSASVQSAMASATSSPSSAAGMLASVTGVPIAVLAVVTPPTIANVAPPPPPLLTGAVAVETSGSIGTIIGVIVGVIIALVLALVFMRRRRHLNEKRRKDVGLQVVNGQPNGRVAQQDEKVAQQDAAKSADEMAAPEPKPSGATKAPEAPKLPLAVEEGLELQNTPLVSSFLGMFSPKFEGVQNVQEGEQQV
jgi:LPXTG-motif cell wall-anchored protein